MQKCKWLWLKISLFPGFQTWNHWRPPGATGTTFFNTQSSKENALLVVPSLATTCEMILKCKSPPTLQSCGTCMCNTVWMSNCFHLFLNASFQIAAATKRKEFLCVPEVTHQKDTPNYSEISFLMHVVTLIKYRFFLNSRAIWNLPNVLTKMPSMSCWLETRHSLALLL